MNMCVDVQGLNLRSSPENSPTNRIAVLHLGQALKVISDDDQEWTEVHELSGEKRQGFVKTILRAQPATGFVSQPSLRDPVSRSCEILVAEAIAQWLRFEFGQAQEHEDPYFKFVGEMWQSLGINLDGRDRDTPWSAAAISFIVKRASQKVANYKRFKGAAAHSKYINRSILQRRSGVKSAPFWGYRLHEQRPKIGDLVARWRNSPQTFDSAAASDSFTSHTDIIVSIQSEYVLAIGGNVGHSVSITKYPKTASGYLDRKQRVFALMANRA